MRVMELHAPLRIVQRSKGRTATAAAAYRAAERIDCLRTGQVHDYTKKRGVEATEIHTAEDAPDWARQRSALWNAAEMREKHPRAQTARELEIGFPHEFSEQQRREAGRGVAKLLVSRYGSAADVAWHFPNRKGDQRNFHAHILFTNRAITADGWAKTKRNALDARETGPDEVKSLRAAAANVINQIAARDRLQVYVEHLSFEDRGLDREATQHLGPNATEMERRGEASDVGDKNRSIQARNEQRQQLEDAYDNVIDFDGAQLKFRRRNAWELYYRDAQTRRAAFAADIGARLDVDEQRARSQLDALRNAQARRHLVGRLWSRVTGIYRDEKAQIASLQAGLNLIVLQRRQAQERFDHEQRGRLEALKADMAKAHLEQKSRFGAFLERQSEQALSMRSASIAEAQQERQDTGNKPDSVTAPQDEVAAREERIAARAKALAEQTERARQRGPNRSRG